MGRVTWEFCLGKRALPQRLNIVVSKSLGQPLTAFQSRDRLADDSTNGPTDNPVNGIAPMDQPLVMVRSLPDAFTYARTYLPNTPSIFVIGGATIYAQTLPFAHRLELTLIEGEYLGDTYFPNYPSILDQFNCVASISGKSLSYVTYLRQAPPPPYP
ncbi:MAG: dihydrofolate reductase [Merismopedia sp. SIO2A8]|nr:dihydrofolate reductase [Merismopedia sp. SIO2A8]